MNPQDTESFDNPQVQREIGYYSLKGDVTYIRDLLCQVENPVVLAEALVEISQVLDDLGKVREWLKGRIERAYFPAPMVNVA
jgi:hypothetical protein